MKPFIAFRSYVAVALELLSVLLIHAFAVRSLHRLLRVTGLKGTALEISWLIPEVLITVLVPWTFRSRAGWSWRHFGLDLRHWQRLLLVGVIGFSLMFPIELMVIWFNLERYVDMVEAQGANLAALAQLPIWQLLLWGLIGFPLVTFLGAALPEEFFFRGYLQGLLAATISPAWAFLVIAIDFSFGHYFSVPGGWFFALQTIPGSLLLGFLYLTTGNIIPGIVAHLLSNVVLGYLIFAHFAWGTMAFAGLASVVLVALVFGWFVTRQEIVHYVRRGVEAITQIPKGGWLVSLGFLTLLMLFDLLFRHVFRGRLEVLAVAALAALVFFLLWRRRG